MNFTKKQEAFIRHYLQCLNGTEAARLAGYQGNDTTLGVVAFENLRKPKIKAEIERLFNENIIPPDEVLARISSQATGSMEDFLSWSDDYGFRINLSKAEARGKLHLIKKFRETENTRRTKDGDEYTTLRREIELYPADGAHDKLMRYHSLYNDKTRIETWKDDVVKALIDGRLKPEDVRLAYGDTLAAEFFARAGIDAS